jgi:hypothetical protein
MVIQKKQSRKRARKGTARVRLKPRRERTGSRVGDDLVKAFEQMAAHLRGEIAIEEAPPRGQQALTYAEHPRIANPNKRSKDGDREKPSHDEIY